MDVVLCHLLCIRVCVHQEPFCPGFNHAAEVRKDRLNLTILLFYRYMNNMIIYNYSKAALSWTKTIIVINFYYNNISIYNLYNYSSVPTQRGPTIYIVLMHAWLQL